MKFLLVLIGTIGSQPADSVQHMEFLRSSYRANKDSFEYGAFHFQYTRGSSASLAAAQSEVFSEAFEETGIYVFDEKNARYDLVADPKVLAAATKQIGELRTYSPINAFRSLTDGKLTLRDTFQPHNGGTALTHGVAIFSGTNNFYQSGFFEFPLSLGNDDSGYDLFRKLTSIIGGDGKLSLAELDMDCLLDGVKVCKLTFTWKNGKTTYWIDPVRGSVPLRILDHYNPNNLDVMFIFSDLEQVPNGGWIPRKRLHIIGAGSIVDRIVVTEIDTQKRPSPSDFELDFPEAVGAFDQAKKVGYAPRKKWSLHHLPSMSSHGVRPVMPMVAPSELPGETTHALPWVIVLGAGVLGAGAAFTLFTFRRATRSQGA